LETSVSKKQFDLSHISIDENLQGARLASFPRRALAYGIDWVIIVTCTEFVWLIVPLGLLYLFVKRRLKKTIVKSSRYIRKQAIMADKKLENYSVEHQLRKRFARHLSLYLHLIIYLPIVVAILLFIGIIFRYITPEIYESVTGQTGEVLRPFFRPISDLNNATSLLANFFGAFLYFSFFTWQWKGQTLGKKLLKIKVAKLNGKPLTFMGSLERTTGYTASAALLLWGFFQYFWDRNRQTTHDKITETIVIEEN
jgi:uncharacterized RDD family membrane protein YckC